MIIPISRPTHHWPPWARLMHSMLAFQDRPSASEALQSPWIIGAVAGGWRFWDFKLWDSCLPQDSWKLPGGKKMRPVYTSVNYVFICVFILTFMYACKLFIGSVSCWWFYWRFQCLQFIMIWDDGPASKSNTIVHRPLLNLSWTSLALTCIITLNYCNDVLLTHNKTVRWYKKTGWVDAAESRNWLSWTTCSHP